MFYHKHSTQRQVHTKQYCFDQCGNHKGQEQNTIHYKATSTYYITTSAEMDEQYLNIQYKSDERTKNNHKLSNSCTP